MNNSLYLFKRMDGRSPWNVRRSEPSGAGVSADTVLVFQALAEGCKWVWHRKVPGISAFGVERSFPRGARDFAHFVRFAGSPISSEEGKKIKNVEGSSGCSLRELCGLRPQARYGINHKCAVWRLVDE